VPAKRRPTYKVQVPDTSASSNSSRHNHVIDLQTRGHDLETRHKESFEFTFKFIFEEQHVAMADTPLAASSEASTPSSAADQARIRKERREAKIRAGGSARLNKITGLGGGIQRGLSLPFSHSCRTSLIMTRPSSTAYTCRPR
jgi:hypothetical protein